VNTGSELLQKVVSSAADVSGKTAISSGVATGSGFLSSLNEYAPLIGIAFTAMTTFSYVYFRRWECRIQEKESEHRMMVLKSKEDVCDGKS
jgi:hypothetical protein